MFLFGHSYTRWDHLSNLVEDALNHKNKACVFIKKKNAIVEFNS